MPTTFVQLLVEARDGETTTNVALLVVRLMRFCHFFVQGKILQTQHLLVFELFERLQILPRLFLRTRIWFGVLFVDHFLDFLEPFHSLLEHFGFLD